MTTQSLTSEQLQALLAFPFKDADWKNKFLIGSLIVVASFIIPLIPFFLLYGYMMQLMRQVITSKDAPLLPAWDDWGKLFVDGLKLLGAALVYSLPIVILVLFGFALFFFGPLLGLPVMGLAGEEGGETAAMIMVTITTVSLLGSMVVWGVSTLLGLAIGLVMPAVLGHVAATDEFGAAFRMKEWWAIFRANIGGFLMAYVVLLLASMLLSAGLTVLYCTIILCCLVPLISAPVTMYLTVIYGAIFGQAYRGGMEKLAEQGGEAVERLEAERSDTP